MTTTPAATAPIERIAWMRQTVDGWRGQRPIGVVPTMGALHEGHASLIRKARAECGRVVVSVFVNPLQFDRKDDLDRYPRTLDADLRLCADLGVDAVFVPDAHEMYPRPPLCTVEVSRLTAHLCGAHRPGHFSGVATVVLKLFEIVRADRAYFGEKDAQQLAIVRRLVADLNVPLSIVGVPTVREADGLALSSRNARLSARERARAVALYQALSKAADLVRGGVSDPRAVEREAAAIIQQDDVLKLEYLDVVDPEELQPVTTIDGPVLVAGAMWAGTTRLIDNITCAPERP